MIKSVVPGFFGNLHAKSTGRKQKSSGLLKAIVWADWKHVCGFTKMKKRPTKEDEITGEASARPGMEEDIRLLRFHAVILPHLDTAHNFARYLTREPDVAEDIVEEAFLHAYSRFDNYRGAHARMWIIGIIRDCFLNWAKSKQPLLTLTIEESPEDRARAGNNPIGSQAGLDQDSAENMLMRQVEIEKVRALLEEMPEPLLEVLVLHELEEFSYQQIAELTAVSIGTVMSRLARARELFAEVWRHTAEKEQG